MDLALTAAYIASDLMEVPVGCAILFGKNYIITHNLTNTLSDPLKHCEIVAIQIYLQYYYNSNVSTVKIFITLEPCVLCNRIIKEFIQIVSQKTSVELFFGMHNEIFGTKKLLNEDIGNNLHDNRCIDILKSFYDGDNPRTTKKQ